MLNKKAVLRRRKTCKKKKKEKKGFHRGFHPIVYFSFRASPWAIPALHHGHFISHRPQAYVRTCHEPEEPEVLSIPEPAPAAQSVSGATLIRLSILEPAFIDLSVLQLSHSSKTDPSTWPVRQDGLNCSIQLCGLSGSLALLPPLVPSSTHHLLVLSRSLALLPLLVPLLCFDWLDIVRVSSHSFSTVFARVFVSSLTPHAPAHWLILVLQASLAWPHSLGLPHTCNLLKCGVSVGLPTLQLHLVPPVPCLCLGPIIPHLHRGSTVLLQSSGLSMVCWSPGSALGFHTFDSARALCPFGSNFVLRPTRPLPWSSNSSVPHRSSKPAALIQVA